MCSDPDYRRLSAVAGLIITTEAMVAEAPKEEAGGAPDMGGMGGMGGMM